MNSQLVIIGLILSALGGPAFCADYCAKSTVFSTTDERGKRIGFVVDRKDFAAAPAWEPGKGEVPLSFERAFEIASRANRTPAGNPKATLLESVSLTSHSCNRGQQHWYYIFIFEVPGVDRSSPTVLSYVGVLLSGKAIHTVPIKDDI